MKTDYEITEHIYKRINDGDLEIDEGIEEALRIQREEYEKELSLLATENEKNMWNVDLLQRQKVKHLEDIESLKEQLKSSCLETPKPLQDFSCCKAPNVCKCCGLIQEYIDSEIEKLKRVK